MDSETGKGDTILNREQKYENLRRADWYADYVEAAIPLSQKK